VAGSWNLDGGLKWRHCGAGLNYRLKARKSTLRRAREGDAGMWQLKYPIQNSNSQASMLSRRNASEVCQSLANREGMERREGAAGGARAPAGTLRGGINVPTSHGKAPCAPKAGAAPPGAPPGHRPVDRSGAPRSGQLIALSA